MQLEFDLDDQYYDKEELFVSQNKEFEYLAKHLGSVEIVGFSATCVRS